MNFFGDMDEVWNCSTVFLLARLIFVEIRTFTPVVAEGALQESRLALWPRRRLASWRQWSLWISPRFILLRETRDKEQRPFIQRAAKEAQFFEVDDDIEVHDLRYMNWRPRLPRIALCSLLEYSHVAVADDQFCTRETISDGQQLWNMQLAIFVLAPEETCHYPHRFPCVFSKPAVFLRA